MKEHILTKETVLDFLSKHKLMTIATYGDHPWIASVYYSFDKNLNIYFLSSTDTLHAKHIASNPQVAVAIADSHQTPSQNKIGLQLYGVATEISNLAKIRHALAHWKSSLDIINPDLDYNGMFQKLIKSRMFRIEPKEIKLFDEELFDTEDGHEPTLVL